MRFDVDAVTDALNGSVTHHHSKRSRMGASERRGVIEALTVLIGRNRSSASVIVRTAEIKRFVVPVALALVVLRVEEFLTHEVCVGGSVPNFTDVNVASAKTMPSSGVGIEVIRQSTSKEWSGFCMNWSFQNAPSETVPLCNHTTFSPLAPD